MTIFVDPYHTTSGMILDMSRVVTPLKECTVRDSLKGTNLGVRSANGVTPVFITGSRDSEKSIPSFTHPILVKNFNTKSYLFIDMTLFVMSGGNLDNLDTHIRRREEFDFTKARAISSLAWVSGDVDRFHTSMGFVSEVFANWMGQTLARNFALPFMDQIKVQMIALAFYESLYTDKPVQYSEDTDKAMIVARKASNAFRIPFTQAYEFYKNLDTPLSSIADFCEAVVKSLNNVNLNPMPNRPDTGFNLRVLFNLIADAWYSVNSKQILAVAVEHPPTLASIIYYCANYNNFRRQQLGQIIQQAGKGGKGEAFNTAFKSMLEEYTRPDVQLRPVMEYMDPSVFANSEVEALLNDLHQEDDNQMNKASETNESESVSLAKEFSNSFADIFGYEDTKSSDASNSDDVTDSDKNQ